jgi:YegS/Rv2252/BmrU family lipid kinase
MRAALIYNPNSGRSRERRTMIVNAAAEILRSAGHQATVIPTYASGSAGEQAGQAIVMGHDTVFACGGDGTIHDVLQGVMQTEATRRAVLGLLPLGTGNVLAHDLSLPLDPIECLQRQLAWKPRRLPLGKVEYTRNGISESRYFITTVGIGADAEMLYRVTAEMKGRMGMLAYLYEGAKLGVTYGYPPFALEYRDSEGHARSEQVSQVMAVRITDFGGFLGRFAPGAALHRPDMQLVLFKTRRWRHYASYMAGVLTRRYWKVQGIELVHATELDCRPLPSEQDNPRQIAIEADGEVLGKLPARVTIVPDALNLLMRA